MRGLCRRALVSIFAGIVITGVAPMAGPAAPANAVSVASTITTVGDSRSTAPAGSGPGRTVSNEVRDRGPSNVLPSAGTAAAPGRPAAPGNPPFTATPPTPGTPPSEGAPPVPQEQPTPAEVRAAQRKVLDRGAASAGTNPDTATVADLAVASTAGTITGTVSLAGTGATNCWITAYVADASGDYSAVGTSDQAAADGSFWLPVSGVTEPLSVRLRLYATFGTSAFQEWAGSTDNTMATAHTFSVAGGSTVSAGTIQLHAPAKVSGAVDLASGGATTCSVSGDVPGDHVSGNCAPNGTFTVLLPWSSVTTSVRLRISATDGTAWWTEWAGSTDNTSGTATVFSVPPSGTVAVGTFTLHPVRRVTGTVSLAASGATGCLVSVYRSDASLAFVTSASTAPDGTFSVALVWPVTVTSVTLRLSGSAAFGTWREWAGSPDNTQATAAVYPLPASGPLTVGTVTLHTPQRLTGSIDLTAVGGSSCRVAAYRRSTGGATSYATWGPCNPDGSFVLVIDWSPTDQSIILSVYVTATTNWSQWAGSTDNTSATAVAYLVPSSTTVAVGTIQLHAPQLITGTFDVASAEATRCAVWVHSTIIVYDAYAACAPDGSFTALVPWPLSMGSVQLQVELSVPGAWGWWEWAGSTDNTRATAHVYAVPANGALGTITLHPPRWVKGTVGLAAAGATGCEVSVDSLADSLGRATCSPSGAVAVPISWGAAPAALRLHVRSFDATGSWWEWVGSPTNTSYNARLVTAPAAGSFDAGAITVHAPQRITGTVAFGSSGATECRVKVYPRDGLGLDRVSVDAVCAADHTFFVRTDWNPTIESIRMVVNAGAPGESWDDWVGSPTNTRDTATVYQVAPSSTLAVGTLTVRTPQRIIGVVDLAGVHASDCRLFAHRGTVTDPFDADATAYCAADGSFRITAPATGANSIKLLVHATDSAASYARWSEWAGSTDNTVGTARRYPISASGTTDIGRISLHSPSRLTGTIDLAGVGAQDCSLTAHWSTGANDVPCASSGAFIGYVDWSPTTRSVTLDANVWSTAGSWWEWLGSSDNTRATARVVTVPTDTTVALGALTLRAPATIQGTVSAGAGRDQALVQAVNSTGQQVGSTYPDGAGIYHLTVGFGTSRVAFGRQGGNYPFAAQYYDGVAEPAGLPAATPITLAAGATRTGVDASLTGGGSITGRVLDGAGAPAAGVHVDAHTDGGALVTRSARTDSTGTYTITGLSSGSYQLTAYDPTLLGWDGEPSWLRWSGNQNDATRAKPVAAVLGKTVRAGDLTIAPPTFTDITDTYPFYGEISWLAAAGISTGYPTGPTTAEYRPVNNVARDAMAAFLYRFAGKPTYTPPASSPFTDVPTSHMFYKEITWLASKGITTGYPQPDGTTQYKPADPVGRDAMAAFLHRFAGKPSFTPPASSPFTDVPASHMFYKEITWLAHTGITTGYPQPDGTALYKPVDPVTRDAMAAFMYRDNTGQLPKP